VNSAYAAACIEKLLMRKSATTNQPLFTSETVDFNYMMSILQGLITSLQRYANLYTMRALFRIVQLMGPHIQNIAPQFSPLLCEFIQTSARNEDKVSANYIYILYETVALFFKNLKGCDKTIFDQVESNFTEILYTIL
jgi:hypothetical protein